MKEITMPVIITLVITAVILVWSDAYGMPEVVVKGEMEEGYFGDCPMSPDEILNSVFEMATLDDVTGFSRAEFIEPWYILYEDYDWPFQPEAYAMYFNTDNGVRLNIKAWKQFDPLSQCSIVAHEIVHSMQHQSGVNFAPGIAEAHAYQVQDLFIREHLDDYDAPLSGNGMSQVRQFKRMQRVMSAEEGHDLAEATPDYCSGDDIHMICEW